MPQIIVTADRGAAFEDGAVTHRERVNVADFESQHFAAQLVERIGWAVEDAAQAELTAAPPVQAESRGDERAVEDDDRAIGLAVEDDDRAHGLAVEEDDRVRMPDEPVSAPSRA